MNATARALKVFLCNADQDQKAVLDLYRRLKNDGVEAWLPEEDLVPGLNREHGIRMAVHEADVVAVCLSNHFNQEGDQQREVRIAFEAAKGKPDDQIFIVPVRLEKCGVSESLRQWQHVDLFETGGYEKLMRALHQRAHGIGITTLQFKKDQLPGVEKNKNREPKSVPTKKQSGNKPSLPLDVGTSQPVSKSGLNTTIAVALIGLVGTIIAALLTSPIIEKLFSPSSPTPVIMASMSPEPIVTLAPGDALLSPVPADTLMLLTPSVPLIGRDGMRLIEIPAGDFAMGSKGNEPDERPVHTVYLGTFFIDQTEITNAMYALCVDSGKCSAPKLNTSITQNESNNNSYYGNPKFDNYPVIYVSWIDAKTYCKWTGRRLPTEAEWEKAASWDDGKKVKRLYPWGSGIDCSYANYYGDGDNLCTGDTTPVGSYPVGASFYGVLDMAGNVWEWVADRYDHEYYQDPDSDNPLSVSGNNIVVRGGSFLTGRAVGIRSSDRHSLPPDNTSYSLGFRCATDVTP
ncbi:MAG: SUMF1/EgtB/PvdO family nonheme iron enzyme [Anaerolineales bacterium]|nr:SUMF1/EgtB/PvdO family nonheme iron enzyme [Anaerolineales bacterium]